MNNTHYNLLLGAIEERKLKDIKHYLNLLHQEDNVEYYNKSHDELDIAFSHTPMGTAIENSHWDIALMLSETSHPCPIYIEELRENLVNFDYFYAIHNKFSQDSNSGKKPLSKLGKTIIKSYDKMLFKYWDEDHIISSIEEHKDTKEERETENKNKKENNPNHISTNDTAFGWLALEQYFKMDSVMEKPTFLLRNLLKRGLSVNAYRHDGGEDNLLTLACSSLNHKNVKVLLNKGADVQWKNMVGQNALQVLLNNSILEKLKEKMGEDAFYDKLNKTLNLLFDKNINIHNKDYHGKDVMDYIKNIKDKKTRAFLSKYIMQQQVELFNITKNNLSNHNKKIKRKVF